MQKTKSILVFLLWLSSGTVWAQVGQERVDAKEAASLDAEREKHALQVLAKLTEKVIVSAADAMPADKYGFAPADGEFKGRAHLRSNGETPVRNQLHSGCGSFGRRATVRCRRRAWA